MEYGKRHDITNLPSPIYNYIREISLTPVAFNYVLVMYCM